MLGYCWSSVEVCVGLPCNKRRSPNTGLVLVHRLRRWPNTKPALVHVYSCVVYCAGASVCMYRMMYVIGPTVAEISVLCHVYLLGFSSTFYHIVPLELKGAKLPLYKVAV